MKFLPKEKVGKVIGGGIVALVVGVCLIIWGKRERGELPSKVTYERPVQTARIVKKTITITDAAWSEVVHLGAGEHIDTYILRDDLWYIVSARLVPTEKWYEYEVPPSRLWKKGKKMKWKAPTLEMDAAKWKLSDKNRGVHEARFRYIISPLSVVHH